MGVAAVISLDVSVDPPVLTLLELLDNEGIGVGVSLDMGQEPGGKGFRDMVVVDAGGRVEVLNEDGVIGSSGSPHNSSLVDILDVAGLHGEAVDDDGEIGYLSAVFFKSFGALDGVSILIGAEAALKVLDCGSAADSNCFKVSAVFGFLRFESFCKLTIPSCLGCRQGVVNAILNVVSFFSKGGDEVLVPIFAIDGALQLVDSRVSDVLGQGNNGLGGELVFPVVDEGEGALGVDDRGFGHLQDLGRHLEVDLRSKDFTILKRVIGRGGCVGLEIGDEDDLAGRVVEMDSGWRHCRERILTFLPLVVDLYPFNGCLT